MRDADNVCVCVVSVWAWVSGRVWEVGLLCNGSGTGAAEREVRAVVGNDTSPRKYELHLTTKTGCYWGGEHENITEPVRSYCSLSAWSRLVLLTLVSIYINHHVSMSFCSAQLSPHLLSGMSVHLPVCLSVLGAKHIMSHINHYGTGSPVTRDDRGITHTHTHKRLCWLRDVEIRRE